ncbi:hypothetical protein SK128_010038 [Halocaridina rubra]|uniref:Uncharacterized protein n=1 Tax=Halocaridina rubra TaxID=373956 RepID=A0AAN8ZVS8_HALRR
MNQFVNGLKSRNEETRVKAACDLQRYVTTELREISLDELLSFLDEFNHHIFEMVSSNDINEKKGGIYAISNPDAGVTELTAKAVGRLALASGTFTAEYIYVEDLVKRSFEWLQGDRNEGRRLAALTCRSIQSLSDSTLLRTQLLKIHPSKSSLPCENKARLARLRCEHHPAPLSIYQLDDFVNDICLGYSTSSHTIKHIVED